ncbi:MAG: DUF4340 domain-containing protein [Desulfobacteraceae bacterium]|nr:DUF4340 domain-containing protein [Desulfobacteraceae bacterium]MBC2756979.1 DUF4340 domain-containing protein [Desulfobacteraceae bacterium]
MKSKKEYIILGIIIAVLAAYLAVHKTDRTHYELPIISKLTDSDITFIKITKDLEIIELNLKDDNWLIHHEKYPADNSKIKPMVDVIKSLTVTALVSEAESYHRYELDTENRISIQAGSDGNILRTFDIGKSAPSNRHTFIKLPNDKRVYHARDNFRSKFDQTKDDLRDKTVLSVEKSQVQQVDIKDKDGNLVLGMQQKPVEVEIGVEDGSESGPTDEKKTPLENIAPELVWQDADGNPVKESDINNFFNNISTLKCQSYIADKTRADFTDPMYTLTMTGTKTVTLLIFEKINEDDDAYPAISSQNDYPFMLPAYKMDNMVK